MHLYGKKHLKILFSKTEDASESLHILLGTSACLQWLCHSGEQTLARGPLVYYFPGNSQKKNRVSSAALVIVALGIAV